MSTAGMLVPDWGGKPPPGVVAAVTLRNDLRGVSGGPYARFNLGDHVGDDVREVATNRARLRADLPTEPLWLNQVHGIEVVAAETAVPGVAADACWTREPGRVCAVLTADCLPVLLAACDGSVVAAAHAGWRGLAAGVIEATVAAMGVSPLRLQAWLGPAIGPQAFEVGDEVRAAFCRHDAAAARAFVPGRAAGKWWCDLYTLARQRLLAQGVAQVTGGGLCTHGDAERFYSFRRDGVTGRMATLIWRSATGPVA
jgi:YfiH family protein